MDFAARVNHTGSESTLCLGKIVRVDSRLVFQTRENQILTRIGYKTDHRPEESDYVNSEPVVPSKVTIGKTVLYYTDSYGCLFNGTVTFKLEQFNKYKIDGKAMKESSDVRYSTKHGNKSLCTHI